MQSHAQAVVIGGGVVGCSVLYHLTKAGWTDVVLLERSELTSGSTWHAAGGMHTINGDPNVAKLQQYTIELYDEIEELSEGSSTFSRKVTLAKYTKIPNKIFPPSRCIVTTGGQSTIVTVSAPKIPWIQTKIKLITASFLWRRYAGC